jgi:hypothetical protein
MPISATVEFSGADVQWISDLIETAQKELGKSARESVAWAGNYVAKSLGAATKVSPKLRPIVRNPDPRYKTDHRRAPWGVYKWDRDGKKYFKPIYRTGEYGRVRFFFKDQMSWFERNRGGKGGEWKHLPSGPDFANPELVAPGIKTDKRRRIGRSGMAKKSWLWLAQRTGVDFAATALHGVSDVAQTSLVGGEVEPSLTLRSNLRYAKAALKSGAVESIMGNAARKFEYNLAQKIEARIAKLNGAQ